MDHADSPKWSKTSFGLTNRSRCSHSEIFLKCNPNVRLNARPKVVCQDETTNVTFDLSLVTTWSGLIKRTPALEVWKYDVCSTNTNHQILQIAKYCIQRNGPLVNLKFDKEHQHTFICIPNTEVFFYVVSHLRRCMHAHMYTYYVSWLLSALTSESRFILAYNIRPKFIGS